MEEKTMQELLERRAAIVTESEKPDADLDALEAEARAIKEEIDRRAATEAKREEIREEVANGCGETIDKIERDKTMTNLEVRNTPEYIKAFAKFIKTGDEKECRALLTENASGDLPVPEFVDEIVRTAWERDAILSRVRKTYLRGNLKVAFERSADPAYAHTEGTTAHTEESLSLGIVEMIPMNVKKYLRISDESVAMGGESFLRYIYDELTYQITHKLANLAVLDVAGASTSHSSSAVGVPAVTAAPGGTAIATAFSQLSDEAVNPVVIMNKATYAAFYAAYAAGNFAADPLMNLPVVYSSALPAYSTASDNAVYAIVGDLNGLQVNYPEGDGVVIKWDDLSEAEKDIVKVVGRQYAAHAVTAPGRFCNIKKPAAAST